jgi:hypothetical protein
MGLFALTIFLSAFLLFNVQPLMGRYLLPWFGGSPAVWSTCILFFQVLLLAGYAYAHWLASKQQSLQKKVHLGLLFVTLLCLPAIPSPNVISTLLNYGPQFQIIFILSLSIGLPFFALSTNAPLIQHWFGETFPTRSPYRLYALSNVGSLLALLVYPLIMEPFLTLRTQSLAWTGGYLLFVAACSYCLLRLAKERPVIAGEVAMATAVMASAGQKVAWVILPALASIFLLATTNQLCQEVASVPFLWVLPLALYLLSFILTFDAEHWYRRWFWGGLYALLVPVGWWSFYEGPDLSFSLQLLLYPALLLFGCMLCHGELYKLRPSPRQLTQFYLAIAAGGALGGLFVTFFAPAVFVSYREYQLALYGICLATLVAWIWQKAWSINFRQPLFWISIPLIAYLLTLPFISYKYMANSESSIVARSRNFFGTLKVTEGQGPLGLFRVLINGRIVHGKQYQDPQWRSQAVGYYAEGSPPAELFELYRGWSKVERGDGLLNVGVVGAGIGTLLAFGEHGDFFRFYEINPQVIDVSQRYFHYFSDTSVHTELISGDGRIVLEKELQSLGSNRYDILVIDAFTSDSIPLHLLTLESVQLYLSHLNDEGILLFHITNRFLDLNPVIRGLAEAVGARAVRLVAENDPVIGRTRTQWVAVTSSQLLAQQIGRLSTAKPWGAEDKPPLVFTDDFSSLLNVLK